jgi:hypothetical protein
LPNLQPIVDLDAPLDEDAAGRRGEIDRGVAGDHFDQTVPLDDALTDVGMPRRRQHGHAGQIEIRKTKFDVHSS